MSKRLIDRATKVTLWVDGKRFWTRGQFVFIDHRGLAEEILAQYIGAFRDGTRLAVNVGDQLVVSA